MKTSQLQSLLKCIQSNNKRGDEWLDKIPPEVNSVFFDNPYVDSITSNYQLVFKSLFKYNMELLEEIEWFFYECDGNSNVIYKTITYKDGSTCVIDTVEDFIKHLQRQGLIEVENGEA